VRLVLAAVTTRLKPKVLSGLDRVRPGTEEGTVLARGAGIAFLLQVAGAGLAYLLQLLFARWMGPSDFGAYTYTIGWATILAVIAGLGLSTAVLRFVPAYASAGDWSRLRGLLRMSLLGTCLASAGISILGTALVVWLHSRGVTTNWNGLLGIWMVPLFAIMTLQQEAARAFRRIGLAYSPSLVLRPLFAIFGALAYLSLGRHLESTAALSITLVAMLIAVGVQAIGFWRQLEAPLSTAEPEFETRQWLRTALPLLLIASFVVVLIQTDVVMVGAIMGSRAAGLYGAAAKTASLVGLVLIAVNAIAAPLFSSLFAEGRHEDLQRLVSVIARWIFWPSLLISLLLAILAKPVLSMFGSEFTVASRPLVILLIGQVVNAAAGSVGWLMLLTGNQDRAAWVYGWVALIHVALLAIAIPLLGIDGAAIATTTSYTLWNIWLHTLVVRRMNIHPSVFYSFGRNRLR
jgi:O-antigen/teichoic acid export membrane protein